MFINKKPLMINDPPHDDRFRGMRWDPSLRSLLCVPLLIKSVLKGVLTVYNKVGAPAFSEEDQRLLAIIAGQSAQVVENARLYELERSLNRMQEELRVAAAIQDDLLPSEPPRVPGFDIAGRTVPAQMVGGDYFDFIPVDDERLALCIGDVSGKGLPAAMLMANVQATLRGQTNPSVSARECIERANRLLHVSTSADKFVTLFYGILDVERSLLRYCNAGHDNPILLKRTGEIKRLETGGVVLSILETFPYEEEIVRLDRGDMLVMYSDGVAEAVNGNNEFFGEAKLIDVLRAQRGRSAEGVIDAIVGAVAEHTGVVPQADDITVVAVKASDDRP
jgi:serine phosphatase RsbU (regulator of sigma subunit)